MFKLGAVTVTRQGNYNKVKHYIANMVLIFNETRLPSTRDIAEILHINSSSVARSVLRLYDEKWLEKIKHGNSPRNSYYKIIANHDQCFAFKQYYLLPVRKQAQFRKVCRDAMQSNSIDAMIKNKRGEVKDGWYFGSHAWSDAVKDII